MTRVLFYVFLFYASSLAGQPTYRKYFLQFRDKAGSPFSLMQPQHFLSAAALERRELGRISLDDTDLPLNPAYLQQVTTKCHKLLVTTKWLNGAAVLADSVQVEVLKSLPFVQSVTYVGPFYGYRFAQNAISKPRIQLDTVLKAFNGFEKVIDGFAAIQHEPMKGQVLRNLFHATGQGRVVTIMDGGFNQIDASPLFTRLDKEGRLLSTRDFVEGDRAVYEASNHGSTVFSVMAAEMPYYFTAMATDAQYHLLITEDTNGEFPIEELNWIAGAEYADSIGSHVINASVGYTSFNDTSLSHSFQVLDGKSAFGSRGATIAARKGMIICNSAGNAGDESWKYIGVPSDAPGIIAVAATTRDGAHASFSSYGPSADGRIKPDLAAPGAMIIGMMADGVQVNFTNGTSFSSPILAAGFAALWSQFPEKSAKEITDMVFQTASQSQAPDTVLGYGLPDFYMASIQFLGAFNPVSQTLFNLPTVMEGDGDYRVLLVDEHAPGLPEKLRLTGLTGAVEEISIGTTLPNSEKRLAMYSSLEEVLHYITWPTGQRWKGLVKCDVLFAEGDPITSYIHFP